MLKYILIFLMITTLQTFSQDKKLDGFLDLKWKSSKKVVENYMKKRNGVYVVKNSKDEITFGGGEFGGYKVSGWVFEFYKNKFCAVTIDFVTLKNHKILYNYIFDQLMGKYFAPKESFGKNGINTDWSFYDGDKLVYLIRMVTSAPDISLMYFDVKTTLEKRNKEKEKANKDF